MFQHTKPCSVLKISHLNNQGDVSNDRYRFRGHCSEFTHLQLLNSVFSLRAYVFLVDQIQKYTRATGPVMSKWHVWITQLVCILYSSASRTTPLLPSAPLKRASAFSSTGPSFTVTIYIVELWSVTVMPVFFWLSIVQSVDMVDSVTTAENRLSTCCAKCFTVLGGL